MHYLVGLLELTHCNIPSAIVFITFDIDKLDENMLNLGKIMFNKIEIKDCPRRSKFTKNREERKKIILILIFLVNHLVNTSINNILTRIELFSKLPTELLHFCPTSNELFHFLDVVLNEYYENAFNKIDTLNIIAKHNDAYIRIKNG